MLGQTFTISGLAPGAQGTRLCHLLSDEALLRRLSGNTGEDCVSALRALNLPDSFWTDEFKVVPCAKTYSHKWTLCPCAHIGETARRRCPRSVNYKAVLCPLVKAKKMCPLGDSCSYAHNVFEHWLHPSRYKTRLCSFGRNCNRSICFFAHSAEELRCVPSSDDKDGDEREYLMQIIMAQESGLLPTNASLEPSIPPAPIPPIIPNLMPDLGSALQQALQQPLPPSNRPSMNGLPDTSSLMSNRPSMSGVPDLMATARASLSGLPDASAVLRASMSGVPDAASLMMQGRASMSGIPDRPSFLHAAHQQHHARHSLNGIQEGLARGRASLNGLHDPAANMLLNISAVQSSAATAVSMQRAMSHELGAHFNAAAAMQHVQRELTSLSAPAVPQPLNAAAVAMERAFTRELAGATSPSQKHAAVLERAYSNREMAVTNGHAYVGPNLGPHGSISNSSRSLGSSLRREALHLAHTPSVNSVESDTLVQLRSGAGGNGGHSNVSAASTGFPGPASIGLLGLDALLNPQAPPRLSDPGANLQHQQAAAAAAAAASFGASSGVPLRASDSGKQLSTLMAANDLSSLESLLPLMNNAIAAGSLALPTGGPVGGSGGAASAAARMRRSNSGNSNTNSNSGRVQSPQLHHQDNGCGSPLDSGSLTPLSTNSVNEPLGSADGTTGIMLPAYQQHHHHHRHQTPGSPPGAAHGAAYEGMLRAAAAAGQMGAPGVAPGAGGMVDQSYLNELVARLQDQGVNKEQLVSSLSQLLAQLLSVST